MFNKHHTFPKKKKIKKKDHNRCVHLTQTIYNNVLIESQTPHQTIMKINVFIHTHSIRDEINKKKMKI